MRKAALYCGLSAPLMPRRSVEGPLVRRFSDDTAVRQFIPLRAGLGLVKNRLWRSMARAMGRCAGSTTPSARDARARGRWGSASSYKGPPSDGKARHCSCSRGTNHPPCTRRAQPWSRRFPQGGVHTPRLRLDERPLGSIAEAAFARRMLIIIKRRVTNSRG